MLTTACTSTKEEPVKTLTYVLTNNTNDSVRLEFKTTNYIYSSYFKKDTVYRIATILKGQSKTLYTSDSAELTLFSQCLDASYQPERFSNGRVNLFYQGTMYGVKGTGADTIRANSKEYPSLSYYYYWKPITNIGTHTTARTLTLR